MIKKKKTQKPVEHDIHLRYLCPQCGDSHWLSYKEASTKNYKIVCDCNNIFMVKRILNFKLKYHNENLPKSKAKNETTNVTEQKSERKEQIIPVDILQTAVDSLLKFGFTKNEAKSLLTKIYNELPTNDIALLIKKSLESLKNVK